jgi:hypothetical protein
MEVSLCIKMSHFLNLFSIHFKTKRGELCECKLCKLLCGDSVEICFNI